MTKAEKKANKWLERAAKKYKLDVLYSGDNPYELKGTFKKDGAVFTVAITDDVFSIFGDELETDSGYEAKFDFCSDVCLSPWVTYEEDDIPQADLLLGCLYQAIKDGGCTGGKGCKGMCERCNLARLFRSFIFAPAHHKVYFPVGA